MVNEGKAEGSHAEEEVRGAPQTHPREEGDEGGPPAALEISDATTDTAASAAESTGTEQKQDADRGGRVAEHEAQETRAGVARNPGEGRATGVQVTAATESGSTSSSMSHKAEGGAQKLGKMAVGEDQVRGATVTAPAFSICTPPRTPPMTPTPTSPRRCWADVVLGLSYQAWIELSGWVAGCRVACHVLQLYSCSASNTSSRAAMCKHRPHCG